MEEMNRKTDFQYVYVKQKIKSENIQFKVISDCMKPLIGINEVVEISACQNYRVGDIVAIYFNNQFYIHRIVKISDDSVVTKGDRTFTLDPECSTEKILGIVTKNLTQKEIMLRNQFNKIVVKLSLYEAKIFEKMHNERNHRKLKYIHSIRKIIEKMYIFSVNEFMGENSK